MEMMRDAKRREPKISNVVPGSKYGAEVNEGVGKQRYHQNRTFAPEWGLGRGGEGDKVPHSEREIGNF